VVRTGNALPSWRRSPGLACADVLVRNASRRWCSIGTRRSRPADFGIPPFKLERVVEKRREIMDTWRRIRLNIDVRDISFETLSGN